jgi:AAA ATPase domain
LTSAVGAVLRLPTILKQELSAVTDRRYSKTTGSCPHWGKCSPERLQNHSGNWKRKDNQPENLLRPAPSAQMVTHIASVLDGTSRLALSRKPRIWRWSSPLTAPRGLMTPSGGNPMESSNLSSNTRRKHRPPPGALRHDIHFVGRQREIARLQKSLLRGETIIVSGKYGIGRTRLIHQLADVNKDYWRFVFVDYSRNATDVCRTIFGEIFPKSITEGSNLPYKSLRFRIAKFHEDRREIVLVLDNIAKLSPQKLDLLRYWKLQGGFQYIAITESFLPSTQLEKLDGCLGPSSSLPLDRLPFTRVQEFFEICSQKYALGLKPGEIHGLAKAAGGYPLSMMDLITMELDRRKAK